MSLWSRMVNALLPKAIPSGMSMVTSNGGWQSVIREPFTGAWQRNVSLDWNSAETFYANFACKTLIARDIAKLGIRLVKKEPTGVWVETTNPSFSPVLRRPNHYQKTANQFWESWMLSKLGHGNTYALKRRDNRQVVIEMYILNPRRVTPLVSPDGSVFYQLDSDDLNGLPSTVVVPATEIIHDRWNCIFHPLVGVPPIYAAALAAIQGLNIQNQSARLYANNATPGGILTAPGVIEDETAGRLKKDWEEKFTGVNSGRIAVLGDGLKFEKMSLDAEEGQLVEQLKMSAETICSTYHVPPYKIGVGAMPSYNNVQALNVEYYTQCLQSLLEDAEAVLDEGLGLGEQYNLGTEFNVDNLLRMDSSTMMDVIEKGRNYITPDEGRLRLNLPPVEGGNVVYRQQQDYSLAALAKRDAQENPFAASAPSPAEKPDPEDEEEETDDETSDDDAVDEEQAKTIAGTLLQKLLDAPARIAA